MIISLIMLAMEAALAAGLILLMKNEGLPQSFQATGPAIGLCIALAFASITKSRMLRRHLGEPVSGWRWDLAWATSAGVIVGIGARLLLPQTLQLIVGVPAILVAFFSILWIKGFGPEDRELFRLRKHEVQELRDAEDAAEARDQVENNLI
jgi:peptidoglycan biosynthesis protein MviN/MurJ (putative lipid II flippase)